MIEATFVEKLTSPVQKVNLKFKPNADGIETTGMQGQKLRLRLKSQGEH